MSDSWNALVTSLLLLAYPVFLAVCLWTMCITKVSFPSHRLAAELSPDESEESAVSSSASSSSSGEEEEEAKLKGYEGSSHAKFSSSSAGASPVPSKNAKDIYNQGHVSGHHATSASTSASASSPAMSPSTTSGNLPDFQDGGCQWNQELNSNQSSEYATRTVQPTSSTQTSEAGGQSFASLAHGSKRRADDSGIYSPLPSTPPVASESRSFQPCGSEERRESLSEDDDNVSIEDVSISHNVPMCPPSPSPLPTPSYSPAPSPRVVATAAEETGGASGSSSDSENGAVSKSSGLQLDIHRRATKYQGPYTLACDVTPSPMQESVTLANTIAVASGNSGGNVTAATTPTTATSSSSSSTTTPTPIPSTNQHHHHHHHGNILKVPRRPRKLPEIPRKHQGLATASSTHVRSIFDEIQEALIKEANDDVFEASSSASEIDAAQQYPYIHKHVGHLFDKKRLLIGYASGPTRSSCRSRNVSTSSVSSRSRNVSTSSVASEIGAAASVEEVEVSIASCKGLQPSPSSSGISSASVCSIQQQQRRRKNSDGDGSRRHSSSTLSTPYQDLEVTHRGMHRFIPRHADEVHIGIGDPIHVIREYDDLWCEGVNLRSGERGIFPAMYANDLTFLEDSDGDDEHWKFTMRFLGAVEVTSSSGDFALCQAINKVAQQGRVKTSSLCTLEINQYGIRMIDKSKEGHESQKFTNFYALKNISFCGTHPNNNRYFAFITKHPREVRFACHVFHSDRSTHRARDALGNAFKRFYQEYMAFTHPTEDIWIE